MGLCPLHILVLICSNIHSWLTLSPDNVVVRSPACLGLALMTMKACAAAIQCCFDRCRGRTAAAAVLQLAALAHSMHPSRHPHPQVLHARTCTGTERQLVHLVAACHLIFSVGCDNMHLALDMLPPLRPLGTASEKHSPRSAGGWAGMGWGSGGMHASGSNASLASEAGASGGARSMRSR